jgi:hypothetical protein
MFFHIGRLIENGSQRFVSGNILFFLSLHSTQNSHCSVNNFESSSHFIIVSNLIRFFLLLNFCVWSYCKFKSFFNFTLPRISSCPLVLLLFQTWSPLFWLLNFCFGSYCKFKSFFKFTLQSKNIKLSPRLFLFQIRSLFF